MGHPCKRILVVDDEQDVIEAIVDALASAGSTVEKALSVDDALRLLDAGFIPSLVLTDIMMPGRSGWDLVDALKQRPATRDIPIVAMSASHRKLDQADKRIDGVLTKPFEYDVLYATLEALCR